MNAAALRDVTPAAHLPHQAERAGEKPAWTYAELCGRIAELTSPEASATLTLAFALVFSAQKKGEPAAWITSPDSTFFPPDVDEGGVDLSALTVVRVPDAHASARAADRLLRSGAFGLIVLDLGESAKIPLALQSRLLSLAQTHAAALLCLTEKLDRSATPVFGSLASLRCEASRTRVGDDRFRCEVEAVKDKRRAPGWTHAEVCRGPAGIR